MKRVICFLLSLSILFAGCGGREANPIPAYLPGDEVRSCTSLMAEIAQLEADMSRILPETNKFAHNTLCAAAGFFLIVPWFFMDLKDAEKVEWEAMRTRRNRLVVFAAEKRCNFGGTGIPKAIPSIEEMKEIQKSVSNSETQQIGEKQPVNSSDSYKKIRGYRVEKDLKTNLMMSTPVYEDGTTGAAIPLSKTKGFSNQKYNY